MEEPQNLRSIFTTADAKRKDLDASWETNSAKYQESLLAAISLYEQCVKLADSLALFSPNETVDDISTNDMQYLLINYRLADLLLRQNGGDRKKTLATVQSSYKQYLKLLDSYEILSPADSKLYELFCENPTTFSTASTSDPAARRDIKIKRFKEEKELRQTLEYLQRNPSMVQNDDTIHRRLQMTQISYCTHQTFQSLESIAQELHILSLAPSEAPRRPDGPAVDARDRTRKGDGYSERLDSPLSAGLTGPLLDKSGKPMRPFTLLDKRQQLKDGVFRPDHSLPTMTIDEYLDEERRRGGMIDGGGPQSAMQPDPNEDDMDKADEETMKARAWDEFVEANPKGAGNTLNRG